ncbi:cell division protein FtsA [Flavobacteriaceae bacterium]|nr:cell division protein FtsA [Flavobacteriaceae bacterium]MDA9041631.1 cell division protein FtsA [Flavobacteriaceae bacterium]MDA9276619.1 cell division protein FtsA [Flavobacteriaceae bacterium]MDB2366708.1 cell division protein FtsA [Flavobacteriaceae bacterium]MDC0923259.1 cell division protein FtsA [Flavobacteriaceae bacterium]
MNKNFSVGLDIGTTKIVAMVGEKNQFNKVKVIGVGKSQSLGVHRGVVNNITQTIQSIKIAIDEAQSKSGIEVKEVAVGIAGQHIRSLQHSDYITRENPDEVINDNDIDKLIDQVYKLVMLPGEEIIHVLPQDFKVDGQSEIKEPIGMYGSRLEANFHIVVGQVSSIRNIGKCIKSSGLEMGDITLEPLASSDAVLSNEEKEAGVALIDIGGGTTDVAIFKDGIIKHTAVIPFGGNVITEDIKEGCSIIGNQAEQLKIKFGSAWPGENKDSEIVSIPGLRGRDPKEISLKTLSKIINARVVEIIEQAYLEIKNYGHEDSKKKLIAGIVLTGGGSQLRHLKQLTEYVTGMDTRIGFPGEHLAGDSDEYNPIYSTAVGLLMKAIENNTEDENSLSNSIGNDLVNQERKTILTKWGEGFKKFIDKVDNVDNTIDN